MNLPTTNWLANQRPCGQDLSNVHIALNTNSYRSCTIFLKKWQQTLALYWEKHSMYWIYQPCIHCPEFFFPHSFSSLSLSTFFSFGGEKKNSKTLTIRLLCLLHPLFETESSGYFLWSSKLPKPSLKNRLGSHEPHR